MHETCCIIFWSVNALSPEWKAVATKPAFSCEEHPLRNPSLPKRAESLHFTELCSTSIRAGSDKDLADHLLLLDPRQSLLQSLEREDKAFVIDTQAME